MRSTGTKSFITVMGINTVSLVISDTPKMLVRSLKAVWQLFGEQHHMLTTLHIADVYKMSREEQHVADLGIILVGANHRHILFLAIDEQSSRVGHYPRGRHD